MDLKGAQVAGESALQRGQEWGEGLRAHPVWLGVFAFFVFLTWLQFKRNYGPGTLALDMKRHKALRGLAHVAAWPLRLAASLFSAFVLLLFLGLLGGFGYFVWSNLHH